MNPRKRRTKILSAKHLKKKIPGVRRGKKLVFTNGCFDLLHRGHVDYLERARHLGDILVVALNTDHSVRKLKGAGRPINPLKDRLEVIAALESVDFVTWFSETTPLRLIELLKPDVLVKGGDWKPQAIVGSDAVLAHGGKVFSLAFVKGRSTTNMIRRAATRG